MALLNQFWDRVRETVDASPDGRRGVQRAMESMSRPRNKNTYTKWLSPKVLSASRPDLRLSDVEDIAAALNVSAETLLAATGTNATTNGRAVKPVDEQLELPFGTESKTVTVQIECTDVGLILNPKRD
jgi:hypothetical protein